MLRSTMVLACVACASCAGTAALPDQSDWRNRPVPFVFGTGSITDAREQWRITFTPDERTAYFAASDGFFPFTRQATIYVSHATDSDWKSDWSSPVVAPFSGRYSDMDPAMSPDGRRLYFSSIRPHAGGTTGDLDIWMVEKSGSSWSDPVHLGPAINTPADELYPSISSDGTLYFARGPRAPSPGEHFDIFSAARAADGFDPAQRLGSGVNRAPAGSDTDLQAAWDFNPEILPDGKTLLFTSLRPGGHGLGDLYMSFFRDGKWTDAENLGRPINSAADEYHPSARGGWLFFVRRDGANGGNGDFYQTILSGSAGPLGRAGPLRAR